MAYKPHPSLDVTRPDEVAECWEGVLAAGLYETLWDLVEHYDNSYRDNIEDIGPHDVIGINSVTSFWDKLDEESQRKLNELAVKNDISLLVELGDSHD